MVNYYYTAVYVPLELHVELKGKHSQKWRQSPKCGHCVSHLLCVDALV